jgi:transcriptional regulator with XRE-family HTH domain
MSLQTLAAKCGVSYQTVQQWEQPGGTAPRRSRLDSVADALGTTAGYLLTGIHPLHGARVGSIVGKVPPTARRRARQIQEIVRMLEDTDEVGLAMAGAAVRVALEGHRPVKANSGN